MLTSISSNVSPLTLTSAKAGIAPVSDSASPSVITSAQPDSQSAVFIRSERYQQLQQSQETSSTEMSNPATILAVDAASKPAAVSPLSGADARAEQTSGTILHFINAQLQRDLVDGASDEELSSRVLAGLDGFKQGFADAAKQLHGMGLLTPDLQAELQQTYDKVVAGAQALHVQLTGNELAMAAENPFAAFGTGGSAAVAPTTGFGSAHNTDKLSDIYSQSFSSQVTQQLLGQRQGVDALLAYLESMAIEAEASPEAASLLMGKMSELADSYVAGGVQEAFEEAKALRYSDTDISEFVHNLSQPAVQRAQQAYGGVQPTELGNDMPSRLQPLVSFVQELRDVQDTATRLQQPEDLLLRMSEVFSVGAASGFQQVMGALLSDKS